MKKPGNSPCMNRRRFAAGLGAVATGAALGSAGCAKKKQSMEEIAAETGQPLPTPPTRIYPDMPRAKVGIIGVKGAEPAAIEKAVRASVEAAGGLSEIEPGQRVLIKPNMCGPAIGESYPGRITTNPEVLRAVIRIVKDKGASEIIVSDRGMFWTELAMRTTGFEKVCAEEGATAFPWTRAEYVHFTPGKRYWKKGFHIPKILKEVDHFINVPVLKNHGAVIGAHFTCCLKSFVGVAHPDDRHLGDDDELHDLRISEKVAELNLSAKPAINIVDATRIMVNGGPDGISKKQSVWVDSNLILAGSDRVACDSLALAVLRRHAVDHNVDQPYVNMSVWDQPQIYYAGELGIGQAERDKIDIEDSGVSLLGEYKSTWT